MPARRRGSRARHLAVRFAGVGGALFALVATMPVSSGARAQAVYDTQISVDPSSITAPGRATVVATVDIRAGFDSPDVDIGVLVAMVGADGSATLSLPASGAGVKGCVLADDRQSYNCHISDPTVVRAHVLRSAIHVVAGGPQSIELRLFLSIKPSFAGFDSATLTVQQATGSGADDGLPATGGAATTAPFVTVAGCVLGLGIGLVVLARRARSD